MNIKSKLLAIAVVVGAMQVGTAFAADPVATSKEAVTAAQTQAPTEGKQMKKKHQGNPRMKECSAELKGKKGAERKQLMSECLKKPQS